MNNHVLAVQAFHRKMGALTNGNLSDLSEKAKSALRITIVDLQRAARVLYDLAENVSILRGDVREANPGIGENVLEVKAGKEEDADAYLRTAMTLEEIAENLQAHIDGDAQEYLDGLADRMYLTIGDAVAYGFSTALDPALTEVCESNLTKAGKDASGKISKGEDYRPPMLAEILFKHGIS